MALFRYKAITPDGGLIEQQVECDSQHEVVVKIRGAGQIPVSIEAVLESSWLKAFQFKPRSQSNMRGRVTLAFTQELASLLEADIPLDRCLGIMNEVRDDASGAALVTAIQKGLRSGQSLSQALESQQGVFPKFYLSMIKTAESSGDLSGGMRRLLEYVERSAALRDQVISALIYPAILALVSALSLVLILTFVVPQFATIFEDMGSALPLVTRMVLGASTFVQDWGMLLVVFLISASWLLRRLLKRPEARRFVDQHILRLPLLGELVAKLEIARFSRSLSTLLEGGVPLMQSMTTASEVVNNHVLADAIHLASDSISVGKRLVDPLIASAVFPKLALQMIKVGEETGNLQGMLLKVANVYDREVTVTTQRLLAVLEPLMIVVLGIAIALIVLSVLVGITSVNDIPL